MNHFVKTNNKITNINDINIDDQIECLANTKKLVYDTVINKIDIQIPLITICIDGMPYLELPRTTLLGTLINDKLCYAYVEEHPKSILLKSSTIYNEIKQREIVDKNLLNYTSEHYLNESTHNITRYLDLCVKNNIRTSGPIYDDLYHKIGKPTLHGHEYNKQKHPYVKCNHISYSISNSNTFTRLVMKKYNTYFRNNILVYDPE